MAGYEFDFRGAKVLVTGGSNGIGRGIASAFAEAGADVTITGRAEGADAYDADLSAFEYRRYEQTEAGAASALAGAFDRLDVLINNAGASWPGGRDEWEPDVFEQAGAFDRLDVLINNAGASWPGGRDEWEPDVFEQAVQINLVGAYRTAEAFRELLGASEQDGGAAIVNLASMSSYFGISMVPGYGAAKAGIVQMTKTLAVSWAERGIRVNAVAPGLIRSNMTAAMEDMEDLWKPMIDRTPMARWGDPEDVAPPVLFLSSSAARYVTGQTLPVDGGYSIA
jgi:NAD(P)-dependent dehydrogenase (short-subunit alcohol dehydrogenase family)